MWLMTEQKALTPAMSQVLRYTAAHGCAAKIGGPWLEVARLLEREGFLELRDCLGGYCAARLTPAGAEALQRRMYCAECSAGVNNAN
jgi:hypothetical protein